MRLLWTGLILTSILIVFSFSRRSGPVRELPPPPAQPRPSNSLMRWGRSIAAPEPLDRRHHRMGALPPMRCACADLRQAPISAEELAAAIRRRFPERRSAASKHDLRPAKMRDSNEKIEPRAALKVIQTLHHHRQMLIERRRAG